MLPASTDHLDHRRRSYAARFRGILSIASHTRRFGCEELDLEQEIRSSASVDCIFVISDCNSDLETSPIPGPISICTWLLKQDPSRLDS